jgi:hypothetical protein
MKDFEVLIGADLRCYAQTTVSADSEEVAIKAIEAHLKEIGDLACIDYKWEHETVQGDVSIRINDGEFVDVENFNGPRYSALAAENELLKESRDKGWETVGQLSSEVVRLSEKIKALENPPPVDGRWDWSGPEEGDGDDTVVIMFDMVEVMAIPHDGDVDGAKDKARDLCTALNAAGAEAMT